MRLASAIRSARACVMSEGKADNKDKTCGACGDDDDGGKDCGGPLIVP